MSLNLSKDIKNSISQALKLHKVSVISFFILAIAKVILYVIKRETFGFLSWISPEECEKFLLYTRIDTIVTGFGIFLCTAILFFETIYKENRLKRRCGYLVGAVMALGFVFLTDVSSLEMIWEERAVFIAEKFGYISFCYVLVLFVLVAYLKFKHGEKLIAVLMAIAIIALVVGETLSESETADVKKEYIEIGFYR